MILTAHSWDCGELAQTGDTSKSNSDKLKAIIVVIIVAGAITFLAGFGLGILDEKTVSTVKDALNAGVEAIVAILVTSAGIVIKAKPN
jgi:hypothetical protein